MKNFHDHFINLKLEQLYTHGDVVLFVWENQDGWPLKFVSKNCEQVLGYSQQEFSTAHIKYSDLIHPDDLERVTTEVMEHSQTTTIAFTHQDYRIKHKNGIYIWVKDTTILEKDENNQIKYYIGHIHDVTANHDLLHQSQLATIGELSSGLAHEIKNPLSSISLATEILAQQLQPKITEKEEKKIKVIQEATKRIQRTIQGMLKLTLKRDIIEREVHRLTDLINETILIFEDKLDKNGINLELNISSKHSVYCDELTFSQTIINLLQNAIDAIYDQEHPYIKISSQQTNNTTEIFITDSGTDFDYQLKEEIFTIFFTTKDRGQGTGIGLHLCKHFMQLNGGNIEILDPQDHPTTTFKISLPTLPK